MADGGGGLSFKAIALEEAIRHSATECLYHPGGPLGAQDVAEGLTLLRKAALDIPVYLVRLEAGYIQRTLQQVGADLISEGRLIPGVTGYAAAFQKGERRVLILVSRALLWRPPPEPVVWRQRDHEYPDSEAPLPALPPPEPESRPRTKRRRNKGNPETIRASKQRRRKRR